MGEVVNLDKRRPKKAGDMFEVIVPLTLFTYAIDGDGAIDLILLELKKRLEGLQYDADSCVVRKAGLPHHKA